MKVKLTVFTFTLLDECFILNVIVACFTVKPGPAKTKIEKKVISMSGYNIGTVNRSV